MLNKIIKLLGIILAGTALFAFAPYTGYASGYYVLTNNVTNVTPSSATFNGFVNGGGFPTRAWFEYSTDNNFSNSTLTNAYSFNVGYGGNYSNSIYGLNQNTTYSFRTVAQNSQGRFYGNAYSFTTNVSNKENITNYLFLTAITESAGSIGNKSVELNSLIYNEAGESSNTWFEWGINPTDLTHKTTVVQISALPSVRHKDKLTGLSAGTTYYFRAVAENFTHRSTGFTLSFATNDSVASVPATPNNVNKSPSNASTTQASTLVANVLEAHSFFPINVFGWFILTILILILIILSKHLYVKSLSKETGKEEHA